MGSQAYLQLLRDPECLKVQFLGLNGMGDAPTGGRTLETFLNELFLLFDLDPRAACSLELDGIGSSFEKLVRYPNVLNQV
jgi:hypothetical protein